MTLMAEYLTCRVNHSTKVTFVLLNQGLLQIHKMPKEKSVNPAQAQRKADKAKAIKKGTFPAY